MNRTRFFTATTIAAPLMLCAFAVSDPALGAENRSGKDLWLSGKTIEFDVSEDAKRFIFDETPLTKDKDGNDVPGDGNEFKTEGYLYPAGTLKGDGDGVNADGSPQYPEKVLGRWICWGYHVGKGGATETGPWVITHQVYDFGDKIGRQSIVSAGFEMVDLNVPIKRAVVGGTGRYVGAQGEAIQSMIGFNQLKGVNLRYKLKLK